MSEALAAPPVTQGHDHAWRLVSVETECGVEIREQLCTTCSAVTYAG